MFYLSTKFDEKKKIRIFSIIATIARYETEKRKEKN